MADMLNRGLVCFFDVTGRVFRLVGRAILSVSAICR